MIPKGQSQPDGRIKVAVSFPRALFHKISARALKTNTRFSEVVADLAACGLLDIEESEAHEPPKKELTP